MSLFTRTSPRIMSLMTISSPGSILKRTTYCCPSSMRLSASSLVRVSELRMVPRVLASYWKLGVSPRLASSSCGVSKAMYALPLSSSWSTYLRYMLRLSLWRYGPLSPPKLTPSSNLMPSQRNDSRMYSSAPGTKRLESVSSIRNIRSPPCWRAKR